MLIQVSSLLMKPADLNNHCFQKWVKNVFIRLTKVFLLLLKCKHTVFTINIRTWRCSQLECESESGKTRANLSLNTPLLPLTS